MSKHYDQYCPIAHTLDLVGERWALLIVRELLKGPRRYTDLADALPGIGTNVLAGRLKDLEAGGVVTKRRLPPPAASKVYELTEYGRELKPVIRELALWGIKTLGPPREDDELAPGWLYGAIDTVFAPVAPRGAFEFRIGGEVASLVDGEARPEPLEHADAVIEAPGPVAFYYLVVEGRWDEVTVRGDRRQARSVIEAAMPAQAAPSAPVAA